MEAFSSCDTRSCCLCGSDESLSGEHKIKASALRAEFGREQLIIERQGEGYKLAQSAGSKAFHFAAPVCVECNTTRTQPADLAFDEFHSIVRNLMRADANPMAALESPRFAIGTDSHLDVHRYFAKLLCCHLAEMGAPRQMDICDFAIGWSDTNCIALGVERVQQASPAQIEPLGLPFAAHGGLIVFGNRETHLPTAYFSTLTIGPVRYKYQASLTEIGQLLMEIETPEFFKWCCERVQEAIAQPQSDEFWDGLGVLRDAR